MQSSFEHSAKGSEWEKHKYIKRQDGKYFYPDSYEGGRHLPESAKKLLKKAKKENGGTVFGNKGTDRRHKKTGEVSFGNKGSDDRQKKTGEAKKGSAATLTDVEAKKKKQRKKIKKLAEAAIRGEYGNGEDRKKALGKKYARVQNKVNKMLLGDAAAKKISDSKKSANKEVVKKATEKVKNVTVKKSSIKNTETKKKKKSPTSKNTSDKRTRTATSSYSPPYKTKRNK